MAWVNIRICSQANHRVGRDRAELDAARHDGLHYLDHGLAKDIVDPCPSAAPVPMARQRQKHPKRPSISAPRIFVADVIYSTDLGLPFGPYTGQQADVVPGELKPCGCQYCLTF